MTQELKIGDKIQVSGRWINTSVIEVVRTTKTMAITNTGIRLRKEFQGTYLKAIYKRLTIWDDIKMPIYEFLKTK